MKKTILAFWVGILALMGFFWVYFPALSHYRDLKQEEERMTRDIAELDGKIQSLLEERDLLKKEVEYIEKVIREELGLVKPGEIVYKFVPEENKTEKTEVPKTPAPVNLPGPFPPVSSKSQPPVPAIIPVPPPVSVHEEPPPVESHPVYPRQETR